jgi:perosamine synthetase
MDDRTDGSAKVRKRTGLALLGGVPVRRGPYPGGPFIDSEEYTAVNRVLESGVLSGFIGAPGPNFLGGPEVRSLEEQWAELGGYQSVVAVNSATAALHAGLAASELRPSGEVIVPPLTMSATIAAVRMAGLVPVFADIDPDLFVLTANTVEAMITPQTVAILVVHLFGQMAPMTPLIELARSNGLMILEDAAQAPGASHNGRWAGHDTAGAIYSFNQNKIITCGEGGLLATDNPSITLRAQLVRNHMESVVGAYPEVHAEDRFGWNYRLGEIEAAIAGAQTRKLPRLVANRVMLAERLTCAIRDVPGLVPPRTAPGNTHTYFCYAVRFDDAIWGCTRRSFVAALQAEGVPCAAGYVPPLYRLPMFGANASTKNFAVHFPVTEQLAARELVLVSACRYPATVDDIDTVGAAVEKCWEHRFELAAAELITST